MATAKQTKAERNAAILANFDKVATAYAAVVFRTDDTAPTLLERADVSERLSYVAKQVFESDLIKHRVGAISMVNAARDWRKDNDAAILAARFRITVRELLPTVLDAKLAAAREQIAKFAADVLQDPAYALEWADKHYEAAAVIKVLSILRGVCEKREERFGDDDRAFVTALCEHVTEETLRRARSVARSTSPSSNVMEDAMRVVYAKLSEKLTMGFFEAGWISLHI